MPYKMPREFYVPTGATKVAHKLSDAVAYISTNSKGKPRVHKHTIATLI